MTSSKIGREDNLLLVALPASERQRLQAQLEWVALPAGADLYSAGNPVRNVYFPTTAVISLVASMRNGASLEVAVVGNEGVADACPFMGSREAPCSGVVLSAGHAWRIGASTIAEFARSTPALMEPLLRYLQSLFNQIAQTSACNRHHSIEQKLSRWLLVNGDRLASNELRATHERIARMLGVRREGVTVEAGRLQLDGLISYDRGHISILDRKGLEKRSCECYSVIRQSHERVSSVPDHSHIPAGAHLQYLDRQRVAAASRHSHAA